MNICTNVYESPFMHNNDIDTKQERSQTLALTWIEESRFTSLKNLCALRRISVSRSMRNRVFDRVILKRLFNPKSILQYRGLCFLTVDVRDMRFHPNKMASICALILHLYQVISKFSYILQ